MPKANISWKFEDEEGERHEVYAEKMGNQWLFHWRGGRNDVWAPLDQPRFEDWLELLDGVRRRIPRKWFRPEEEGRLVKMIQERFPDAQIDPPEDD